MALFLTHPPTEDRIERLKLLAQKQETSVEIPPGAEPCCLDLLFRFVV